MKKYFPFLIAGGALALYFLSKSGAAGKLRVYFKSVSFGKTKGFKLPEVFAVFRLVNPTNTPLDINSLAGDIYFNKNLLASVQNLNKVTVNSNSELLYSVKIESSAFSLIQTLYDYIRNKQKITVSFDGTVNSSGIVIPVKQVLIQN
jgi:LEA14-like dessication related protein